MEIKELEGLVGTEFIQDTFLFRQLNFDETLALAGLFRREARKKGAVIIEEGALGQALYIIEKGRVRVTKQEGAGNEVLAVLGPGELFGEMSLIEDELTSATVVADTEVSLLTIQRKDFEDLLERERDIALKAYKAFCFTLSERLRRTSQELGRTRQKLGGGAAKTRTAAASGSRRKKPGRAKPGSSSKSRK